MKYRVVLIESDEGVAASCPQLRGCHSQGETVEEALDNIKDAIIEWLDAEKEEMKTFRNNFKDRLLETISRVRTGKMKWYTYKEVFGLTS